MKDEETKSNQTNKDEIDLIAIALKIWGERRIIFRTVAVFFVLGLIIAFGSKEEYKAETTFILQDNEGGSRVSGLLSQFGGMAGFNLGSAQAGDIISPEIFPNVIHSTSFLVKLAREPVYFETLNDTFTLGKYFYEIDKPSIVFYLKSFTIGLPHKIINLFKKNEEPAEIFNSGLVSKINNGDLPLKLSKTEQDILNILSERIKVNFDDESGILNLNTELPDPSAAAEVTKIALERLTDYIIKYQTEKALRDLNFIDSQYQKSKERFELAQKTLAEFTDKNKNVVTAKAQIDQQRLQAEYDLAFNIYNGLAQQLEQAKIKVQEKTPVFKIINEVKVPVSKVKPRKVIILVIALFLGTLMGGGIIFIFFIKRIILSRYNLF